MVIFYSILDVDMIKKIIIHKENNSSKINHHDFLKKFYFELMEEQHAPHCQFI